ncbi:MAG: hypothetical protein KKC76_09250 [Proteobacteria bacterium]|nr:hypothetical protein [Pseudomonadota bacterium]MBU4297276.1 hypothetical protein [Pseudomonadota bacterium]MCG2750139.1 hypothetical protein [Desulfobulbaceae bacterium]
MSAKVSDPKQKARKRDPDFIKAEIAMQRAAQKAREKARLVGSGVAILKEGKIVEEQNNP